ncbi:MAG: hypothetical protein RIT45_843 [Pseudomonadota bacterium]
MTFSIRSRAHQIASLRDRTFDVLVVGGGITGAGLARDAALRGLDVALVDRDDFAAGTSSRSSKLIHGGLRYLEQGDVGLVFEAVRERQRLLKLAPHLALPQSFVVPVYPGARHSVLMLDLGLTIYDTLAAFSGVLRHRAYRRGPLLQLEPLLHPTIRGGVRYYDAQTHDARLVLANLRGAAAAGAVVTSRVCFDGPRREAGRVIGAALTDIETGESFEIATRTIVLAAGPFADDAMARFRGEPLARPIIRPSKGVHIVVPRARLPLSEALLMSAPDGRVVFALPWPQVSVIGTTDTPFAGDLRRPRTTVADADYLLEVANLNLKAPAGPLVREDIVSTWAGIRPLAIGTRDDGGTYKTSREHVIEADPSGMVLIAGGKLTTYRVMAAQGVDAVLGLLPAGRRDRAQPCVTADLPLPGAEALPSGKAPLDAMATLLVREHDISEGYAHHLSRSFGSDAIAILAEATGEDAMRPVLSGVPTRWAEVDWSIRHELPMDLVDLAVRRLPLYYVGGDRVLEVADALAARLCAYAGWGLDRHTALVAGLRDHVEEGHLAEDDG